MVFKKMKIISSFLLALAMGVSLLCTTAFATTVNVLGGQISLTDTQNTIKNSSGIVTATAKGSLLSKKTNTITITNETDSTAELSFDYSVSKSNSFTIDNASAATSGSLEKVLATGGSVEFSITSNSGLSNTTVTLTMSNFSLTAAAASSEVTFSYDSSCGSVTVDGTSIASGDKKEIPQSGAALVAVPKSGVTFLGWIDADTHQVISTAASYTLTPTSDMAVQAVFASGKGWFLCQNGVATYLYDDLNAAGTFATTASDKKIVLANNGTLSAGDYTIPSGVTLLIPYDDANTVQTTAPATTKANSLTEPTAYRTLTMASGANITVNGAISIAGTQHSSMAKGTPFGPVGFIKMNDNSSITINSGANLYAWGYITGSGSVTIKSGGNVYECFQVSDWRGGSATSAMVENSEKIFPITQYYVQNVEVPMTLEAGAAEYGFMSVNVSLAGIQNTTIAFIGGSDNGMFRIEKGSIIKDYDEDNDRMVIDLNEAELNISQCVISIKVSLIGAVTLDSKDYVLPVTTNLTLNVHSNSTVYLSQDIAFLPGSEVNIEEGAFCTVTNDANVYIYDVDDWGKYCGASNLELTTIAYAPGKKKTRTAEDLVDASILVNGTVDASAGYVYTTAGGANIYSDDAGQVIQRAGTTTVTYQATYVEDDYTPQEIAVKPAWLKNGTKAAKEYTETATATAATTYYYCKDCTTWVTAKDPVAQVIVGGTSNIHYHTLAEAVTAYGDPAAGKYIQMLANSENETVAFVDGTALDLNGCDVSGVTLSGTFYGADSSSDGFAVPGGSITVSGSTVAAAASINDKDYVAHYDSAGGTYSFHRFAITPVACRFYLNSTTKPTHSHLAFKAALQGDDIAIGEIDDLGFVVNGTEFWYGKAPVYTDLTADEEFASYKTISVVAVDYEGTGEFGTEYKITAKAKFDDKTISSDETPAVSMTSALEQAGIAIG